MPGVYAKYALLCTGSLGIYLRGVLGAIRRALSDPSHQDVEIVMITHESLFSQESAQRRRHPVDDICPTCGGPYRPMWHASEKRVTILRTLVRGLLSQGFQALVVYRIFRWFHERGIPTQPIRFFVERLTEIVTGISIPAQAQIGKGLRIHHFGGIIIHSETVIGEGCTIYHGVTLGDRGGWGGAPRIGNHVMIGAGAKILGRRYHWG